MRRRLNENKYKTGKIITSFSNYVRFVNESYSFDTEEVNKKIRRVILWININQGFYGELLSHVNIFGSSNIDPKTMCTNGRDIIFHPEFVMNQTEAALRFVLCHEILHCIGDHGKRRENRDPQGWNIACDYAINPLLQGETGFEWPVCEDGSRAGLYDARFEGMRAEDIYQQLEDEGKLNKLINDSNIKKQTDTGRVEDEDKEQPEPDEGMVVQQGDNPVDEPGEEPGEGEPGEGEPGEGEPGEGEPGEGEPGEGEPGEGEPGEGEPGDNKKSLPRVGQKVITKEGKEGTITKVYPNGDIEIS
jgi:hypothetical protein